MSNFDTLLAAIAGAPALHGARCRGKGHLFDSAEPHENPDIVEQRHNQAIGLCHHCPALGRCESWVLSLKPSRRPPGIVAGQVWENGRPKSKSSPGKAAAEHG
jgi:WhiB family redox-sensing transcriptional regulator